MKRKRNMGELEELTYLKTVGDLRQHIGHVLHYSYTDFGDKLIKDTDPIPRGFMTFGTHLVVFKSAFGSFKTPSVRYLNEENMSNAFEHIRIPTKDELNKYNKLIRHARIFGLEEKS